MFGKVFLAQALTLLFAVAAVCTMVLGASHAFIEKEEAQSLEKSSALLADEAQSLLERGASAATTARTADWSRLTGARVSLLDAKGLISADSEGETSMQDASWITDEIRTSDADPKGFILLRGRAGRSSVVAMRRLMRDGRTVGYLRLSSSAVPDEAWSHFRRSVWGAALTVGSASLLFAAVLAYRFSSRLHELSSTARHIVRGDYDRRIDVSSEDEVGTLARSFHQMRQELRQRIEGLERVRKDLRTMLETIPECVIALDIGQRVLFANPTTYPLFGLPKGDIVGQRLWEVVRHPKLQEAISATFESNEPVQREFEIQHPHRALEFRGRGLAVESGRGVLVVLHDVSELRRLERLRQDFFANVSHELKTPLASIKAYTETLIDGGVDERPTAMRFLRRIDEQAERLHLLVQDMLMLSRVESQAPGFDIQPVDLHRAVAECLETFSEEAASKGLCLDSEVQVDARFVLADAEGIRMVLSNLVDNAVKYTPAGGHVRIRCERREDAVQLSVADDGVGIPAEDLRRIFERFYRVDKARSRELGGTGLGLSIVKHLAQTFGGSVSVTSRPNHGSTFTVHLPRHEPGKDGVAARHAS